MDNFILSPLSHAPERRLYQSEVDALIVQAKQQERDRINAEMETFIRKRYSIKSFIEAMRKVLT